MSNLAGLCATHHGVIHRHGWHLELEPDGTLIFRRPDGHTLTSPPPRRHRPPPLPLRHHRTRGLIPEFPEPASPAAPAANIRPDRINRPGADANDTDTIDPDAAGNPGWTDGQIRPHDPDDPVHQAAEPTDHDTARMVRARVVDLVQRHHRWRRHPDHPIDPVEWPEAG